MDHHPYLDLPRRGLAEARAEIAGRRRILHIVDPEVLDVAIESTPGVAAAPQPHALLPAPTRPTIVLIGRRWYPGRPAPEPPAGERAAAPNGRRCFRAGRWLAAAALVGLLGFYAAGLGLALAGFLFVWCAAGVASWRMS